jgi:hypothetical protein
MRRVIGLVLVGAVLGGCATASGPPSARDVAVYPSKGQTQEQQSRDMSECTTWAKQQSNFDPATDTAKGAGMGLALGALGGAALGAATGAIVGSPGTGAAVGAVAGGATGAAVGGTSSYGSGKDGFDKAYAACMTGRGYAVSR